MSLQAAGEGRCGNNVGRAVEKIIDDMSIRKSGEAFVVFSTSRDFTEAATPARWKPNCSRNGERYDGGVM